MSYKSEAQTNIENSPVYAVRHWRKSGTAEETLDDFLFWLEYDFEASTDETVKVIKALIDEYLGRDMQKIKQGEKELLDAWIKATRSTK